MNNWLAVLGLMTSIETSKLALESDENPVIENPVIEDPVVLSPHNSGPVLSWRVDVTSDQINSTSVEYSAPAIYEERIFLGLSHKTGLHIFNRESGYYMGSMPTKSFVQSPPLIIDHQLFVADLSGTVYAWDLQTQQILWEIELGIPVNSQIVSAQDQLFVSTNEDVFYALNQKGEVLWRYAHRVNPSRKNNMQLFGGGTPLLREKDVVIGFSDGALVILDRYNGAVLEQLWNGTGRFPDIIAQPVAIGQSLMVASFELSTWKQDASQVLWEKEVGGMHHGLLIAGEEFGLGHNRFFAHPGADGHLRLIDTVSGNVLWDWDSGAQSALTHPQVWQNNLLISSSTGSISIIDLQTGKEIWRDRQNFNQSGSMHGPLIVDDEIFLLSKAGFLQKYQNLSEQQWTCHDQWCSWLE